MKTQHQNLNEEMSPLQLSKYNTTLSSCSLGARKCCYINSILKNVQDNDGQSDTSSF